MKDRRNSFEQIRAEITETVDRERVKDSRAIEQETEIRRAYNAARELMAIALDSGDMERYAEVGHQAEQKRLELEFIEKDKANKRPAKTDEENLRIKTALVMEKAQIRADALARLKMLFTEAAAVCADAKNRFAELELLADSWSRIVMKEDEKPVYTRTFTDALPFAQIASSINGQLGRIDIMEGKL